MKKHTIMKLGKYLFTYKWMLLVALTLTIGSNLFALIGPLLSGYAIDAIELGADKVDFGRVFYYSALMIIFYIISSVLSYLLSILMIQISRKVVYKMRKDVFAHLMEMPVGYFDTHQTGDIISRISYDIDTVNASLSNDLVQLCASAITIIISLIMMIIISPKLVLVFVVTVPMSVFLTKKITKQTRPLFRKRSRSLGNLNGYVEEKISGQKTIKAYIQEDNIIKEFSEKNEEAVQAYYMSEYYGSMVGPTVNFINNLSLSLISVFGAILYLLGQMTIGNISSFVLYSRKFSGPINEAANIISELQSAIAAAERIFKLLEEDPEVIDKKNAYELTKVKGDVDLRNVTFGYDNNQIIIKNLNLKADSGKMVAIAGPTGAGKTTIINLLMRFYDVGDGNIYVDEYETREVTRASLRKSYAMVLQDTWLFYGTVFENIAYGKEGAELEDVVRVAKAANIHSFIEKLPQGYHTILSDEGTNISKGQKQLLTIARAMLLDANMLILDEATSNVDTRTELQIQAAMRQLMKDKTCFVIAHRLSTIQNADIILVVDQGKIVEQGNHDDLMKKEGFYYNLYHSQYS